MIKNARLDKGHSVSTILTSDSELMLNTYMVTPTTTGGPEITITTSVVALDIALSASMAEYWQLRESRDNTETFTLASLSPSQI